MQNNEMNDIEHDAKINPKNQGESAGGPYGKVNHETFSPSYTLAVENGAKNTVSKSIRVHLP